MISLSRYQRLAYNNPIIEEQPPTHMPDGWMLHRETIDGQTVMVAITVSVAAENRESHGTDAIWDISVSIWPSTVAERLSTPQGMPIEVSNWTDHHSQVAGKAYEANTQGIGRRDDPESPGVAGQGTHTAHLRLPMSEEERAGLDVEPK